MAVALWAGGGLVAAVAGSLALLRLARRRARRRRLADVLAAFAPDVLTDVTLPDDGDADGGYPVDALLRCSRGLVVLAVRQVRGTVFAAEHMDHWTVMDKGRRWTFPNPLHALYDRMAAVSALVGESVPVEGAVVLLPPSRLATSAPPRTFLLDDLEGYADPAVELGAAHAEAWAVLAARARPTVPELRRR